MLTKINKVLRAMPAGGVVTSDWLRAQGVYQQLAARYVASGWLERVGRGAYKRRGERVDLMGALYALQSQLGASLHPGGKTAFQLRGHGQFLKLWRPTSFEGAIGEGGAYLFGAAKEKVPAWFKAFQPDVDYTLSNLFGAQEKLGVSAMSQGSCEVNVSSLERAMFEVCFHVPEKVGFEEALELSEGLITLRPQLVQELFEACRSVKAKRLFLYFAEKHSHAWTRELDLKKVDFGKGKRSIVAGGEYIEKYQIVVPRIES